MRIPFLRPTPPPPEAWVPHLENAYAQHRFSNFGPLSRAVAEACRERFAVPGYEAVLVSSATAGLTAALIALDVRGKVVIPAFTFAATLAAVTGAGCRPVLCDADLQTWEMDLAHLEHLLRDPEVAAVMPVRSYGLVRDQTRLKALCAAAGRPIVFDSAAALGGGAPPWRIGSPTGEVEVFSLHATKVLSIGEGGVVFAPPKVASALEQTINFGFHPDRSFSDGLNGKVDEFRAAIGLAALEALDAAVAERVSQAEAYGRVLAGYGGLISPPVDPGPTPWQTYPVRFADPRRRERFAARLSTAGIETRRYYWPALSSGYRGRLSPPFDPKATPKAERLAAQMLCLPILGRIQADEQDHLLKALAYALDDVEGFSPPPA